MNYEEKMSFFKKKVRFELFRVINMANENIYQIMG